MQNARAEHAFEPLGQRSAARPPFELGLLPERSEREEGENEDDGPAPEEEPIGNGEVADASDPMGDQAQGRTSSTPINWPRSSSSISNWPGVEAVSSIRPGRPGATSAIRS